MAADTVAEQKKGVDCAAVYNFLKSSVPRPRLSCDPE